MLSHDVYLGAAGWQFPGWQSAFFPDGMPEEWRLAYYNTQFSCVWLPRSVWRHATPAEVAEWAGDVRPEFRVLLEKDGAATNPEREILDGFGGQAECREAGDPDLIWIDAAVDLRSLADVLRRRAAVPGCTFLLSRDGDLATLAKVANLLDVLNLGPGARVG